MDTRYSFVFRLKVGVALRAAQMVYTATPPRHPYSPGIFGGLAIFGVTFLLVSNMMRITSFMDPIADRWVRAAVGTPLARASLAISRLCSHPTAPPVRAGGRGGAEEGCGGKEARAQEGEPCGRGGGACLCLSVPRPRRCLALGAPWIRMCCGRGCR
jgi:hypothetical protein